LLGNGTYRGDITKLILLASQDLPENAPHDLAAARLGEIGHDEHGLGGRERTDTPADLQDELLSERIRGIVAILDRDKGVDSLAGELVRHTNDGSLGDGIVLNQGSLDLRSRQTVATNVHDIVDTAADPVESLMVTTGTVTRELNFPVSQALSRV
jgi:hypothetical protein